MLPNTKRVVVISFSVASCQHSCHVDTTQADAPLQSCSFPECVTITHFSDISRKRLHRFAAQLVFGGKNVPARGSAVLKPRNPIGAEVVVQRAAPAIVADTAHQLNSLVTPFTIIRHFCSMFTYIITLFG